MYIRNIAREEIVEEVLNRIRCIDIDAVIGSSYIEEYIEDHSVSPFPQCLTTVRPDAAAAHLLEGRVVVICAGSPFVLIVPVTFFSLLHTSEDHYSRFQMVSFLRFLRFGFALIALILPSMYVAITTFHQEMIPTDLLFTIAAAREGVPFPALIEALVMEIVFEALREAGIRLPKILGPTVGILGAIVIGQAAVQAGIVSAPMVIIVSLTGIASFTIPQMAGSNAIRLLRFPMILLAGSFGMIGISCGLFSP